MIKKKPKNNKGKYSIEEINRKGLDKPAFRRLMQRIAKVLIKDQKLLDIKTCPCCNSPLENNHNLLK